MVYGMNFDMLTDKKRVWMGFVFCPLPLYAGRLHFFEKGLMVGGYSLPRHDRNEKLFLIARHFPAQNTL